MSNHIGGGGGGGGGISVKPQSFQKRHLDTILEVKYLFLGNNIEYKYIETYRQCCGSGSGL